MTYRAIVAAAGLLMLAGCAPQESAAPTPALGGPPQGAPGKGGAPNIMTGDAPGGGAPAAPGRGPGGGGPGGGGGFGMAPPPTPGPGSPLQASPDKDKAIADAEKAGDKKATADAYLARAIAREKDSKAHYQVRLPAAREDLKKALEADPGNTRAQRLDRYIAGVLDSTQKQDAAKAKDGKGAKPKGDKP